MIISLYVNMFDLFDMSSYDEYIYIYISYLFIYYYYDFEFSSI